MGVWGRRIVFYLGLVLIWYLATRSGAGAFPSPVSVGQRVLAGIIGGEYVSAMAASLGRIVLGFGLAIVAGISLGLLSSRTPWVGDTMGPLMIGFQALPSVCWFPLVILWLGANEKAILFVTVVGAMFAIATGVESGVKSITPLYLKAAANMGATGWELYVRVILPASLPAVIGGLRLGWSFAWRSLMAGELLAVTSGLGHLLTKGRSANDTAQVTAVVLVILLVGLAVDALVFDRLESRIRLRFGTIRNA